MSNLTVTAHYTRRVIFWSVVGLTGFVVIKGAITTAGAIWKKLHPEPPPPPNLLFGTLPQLSFPAPDQILPEKISYKLETVDGLPKFPEMTNVYFITKIEPNLLSLERANQKALRMGFRSTPEALEKFRYRWNNLQIPPSTLEMDVTSGNFYLRYPYENDPSLLTAKNLANNEQAIREARSLLSNAGLLTEDLASGSAEVSYYHFDPPKLVAAPSLSEADFIRVDLFRAPLNNVPVLPPNPTRSLISVLLSGSRESGKRIVEAEFAYAPVERETFGTYPLKPIDKAWQELQAGQGYIANLGENPTGNITIRRIYLAYYESEETQSLLQPVYVFEGDGNFAAYVTAAVSTID